MQLISFEFILFAAITLFFYYLFSQRLRWVVLLLSSIVFYCFSGLLSLIFICFFTLSSYFLALLIGIRASKVETRREGNIYICLFSSLMLAAIFLAARELSAVALLGISFYSLRVIAYLIDVYRGRVEAEKKILKYSLFVLFFPLAHLGPIALYGGVGEALCRGEKPRADEAAAGVLRIAVGLFKKIVIANALALPLERIANDTGRYFGAYTLFLLIFYTVRIFCDFSGGIDICIGLSALFGVGLPENFDRPFFATSIREFWNRWHITLGEWFERYVFYPLSLSRPMQKISRLCRKKFGAEIGKRLPLYAATLFTWSLTGIWHGIRGHFVAWGVINAILVLVSRESDGLFFKKNGWLSLVLRRAGVFLTVGAVRLLDVYKSLPLTLKMLSTVIMSPSSYKSLVCDFSKKMSYVDLSVIFCSMVLVLLMSRISSDVRRKPLATSLGAVGLIVCTMIFGTYGRGFDAGDFIYSRFNGG